MAKVKVKVLDAVVDGKRKGETLEIREERAKALEKVRYVEIVKDEKPKDDKKPAKKANAKQAKKKDDK